MLVYEKNGLKIYHGDCIEILRSFEPNSVDAMVTDPPYGIRFMGKDWDKAVPSVEVWKECLRVLKNGAFAFIMCSPRQDVFGEMITRLELAGFETGFTSIYWTYAGGFTKAENIPLHIDKGECKKLLRARLRREPSKEEFEGEWKNFREVVGQGQTGPPETHKISHQMAQDKNNSFGGEFNITRPRTEKARELEGSFGGFQPKPAVEIILVAMKPLSEKAYVQQALKNKKGITWLDGGRIPIEKGDEPHGGYGDEVIGFGSFNNKGGVKWKESPAADKGRFPANLLVSDDILSNGKTESPYSRFFSLDAWAKKLPFLICPKAGKNEKNKGCGDFEIPEYRWNNAGICRQIRGRKGNFHPTVKPVRLMSYLIALGSRENDLVLDPYLGSGTTLIAAKNLKRRAVGIEIEKTYIDIAIRRIGNEQANLL